MQNRFSFRAWNKREQKMIYNAEDVYDGALSGWCGVDKENNNDGWISCFGEYLGREEYIVMQCTGLKDKNNKLIYEGDIIKYTDCEGKETIGYLCVDRFNLLTFTDIKGVDFCEEWVDIVKAVFFAGTSKIEIVGNLYENKDLLEEQK